MKLKALTAAVLAAALLSACGSSAAVSYTHLAWHLPHLARRIGT